MTDLNEARTQLAAMEAEEVAARKKLEDLANANAEKKQKLLDVVREADLADVRKLCEKHGFTATELRGVLKRRGRTKKSADATTSASVKSTRRRKVKAA